MIKKIREMSVRKIITNTRDINLQTDGVTLLSVEEYKRAKKHIKPTDFYWWLRSPGGSAFKVAVVSGVGDVDYDGYVDGDYGLRPALRINLKSSELQIGDSFRFGGYTWTVISDDYALCDTNMDNMPFRKEWNSPDANDYEKSDVKKFLDDWYINQMEVTENE